MEYKSINISLTESIIALEEIDNYSVEFLMT